MRKLAFTLLLAMTTFSAYSQAPDRSSTTEPKRTNLFVGNDTSGLMPINTILPKAADIESAAEKLSSRLRNQDPFGLETYPTDEVKPIVEDIEPRATARVTLNQALQTLKINGVNLAQREILIGGRNAFVGDVLELSFRDQLFQAQLIEVGASQIIFHDIQRKETGVLQHSVVPNLLIEPMREAASPLVDKMTPIEATTSKRK